MREKWSSYPERIGHDEAGRTSEFSKKGGNMEKEKVNPEEYTSWKGGKIYYDNEKLINITLQLERWYEVKFKFENENAKSYRFTGVINKSKSLKYVLNLIQEINKVKFETNKEQIIIKDKKQKAGKCWKHFPV